MMKKDFFVFGGTFDPVHQGHVGVIRELKDKTVIIAPTFANPFKQKSKYSFEQRLSMLKKVLDFEKIDYEDLGQNFDKKVLISNYKYEYVTDFVLQIKAEFKCELTWVIGPDLVEQVKSWKDWDKMNLKLYVSKTHAGNLRATNIRNGKEDIHPALSGFE